MKWHINEHDDNIIRDIKIKYGVSDLLARMILNRNIDIDNINDFIDSKLKNLLPDPFILKDMDKAVKRILTAIYHKQKIIILGDYDVDGATSSSLIKRFMKMLDLDSDIFIPDRILDGYGPSVKLMDKFKMQGYDLVIIVDSGTVAFEPLEHAYNIKLDTIVIDHHIANIELPKAIAVINPNRIDEGNYGLNNMAAVGVSFLVIVAIARSIDKQYKDNIDLISLLDLVALGTVCDVMSIRGLNRAFVKQGLKVMSKANNLGLKTIIDHNVLEKISAYHLGFVIGPRINAGGRVGQSTLGARLLTTHDAIEALEIVQQLENFNLERKEIENHIKEEAIQQYEINTEKKKIAIVYSKNWHVGVIGIVASRLKELYNIPAVVIAFDNDIGKASCRSIDNIDIGQLITEAKHKGILLEGGGHKMAGGFSINYSQLQQFIDFMELNTSDKIQEYQQNLSVEVDAILSIKAVNLNMVNELEILEPYGVGNKSPKFIFQKVIILSYRILSNKHISCVICDYMDTNYTFKAIAFNIADTDLWGKIIDSNDNLINILGQVKKSYWNNKEELSILIEDIYYL